MYILRSISFIVLVIRYVSGDEKKCSLTFVIDRTMSMHDDIDQVKLKTIEVFDAVLSSNASRIDDFILVTFDDPSATLRTITRDPGEFKSALQAIDLFGNYDCPEYSMAGIGLALEKSKPNSFLYVFTDASAKDFDQFNRIKTLSQKKSIQVTFLLTGVCPEDDDVVPLGKNVYNDLAAATSGEVFHIHKQDINLVIDYIIASIKEYKTSLGQKRFTTGVGNNLPFTVDSKEWNVLVSVSSANPSFDVFDSDGNQVKSELITSTATNKVLKVNVGPGKYSVSLLGNTETSVKITASTLVTFDYGFSIFKPASLGETATTPISGELSHLLIKLNNKENDVILDNAILRDMNDNIILKLPLKVLNKEQQLYLTKPFISPEDMFKIEIQGHTRENEYISRVSATTVQPQSLGSIGGYIQNKSPEVKVLADPSIEVDYNESLVIKCEVLGYPKPDVSWTGLFISPKMYTVIPVDLPYDYMSLLTIDKVTQNLEITCNAVNSLASAQASIEVRVKKYFRVLERPRDVSIDYGKSMEIKCIIDAFPPATTTWYRNNKKIKPNKFFGISKTNDALIVKFMYPKLVGAYSVKITNHVEEKIFKFHISTTAEKPKIKKTIPYYIGREGEPIDLYCSILKGLPKPSISWEFSNAASDESISLDNNSESLHIETLTQNDAGIYRCVAENEIGSDYYEVELRVEYSPYFNHKNYYIYKRIGDQVTLTCPANGLPSPTIQWFKNGMLIHDEYMLRFSASIEDIGNYTCEATNYLGKAKLTTFFDVFAPLTIQSPENTIIELEVGSPLTLDCIADGYPEPSVSWSFNSLSDSSDSFIMRTISKPLTHRNNSLSIPAVQIDDEGLHTCTAWNRDDSVFLTYTINVLIRPTIENDLTDRNFDVVEGDLVLKIPCDAIGRPEPTVTWQYDGFNIASGTDRHFIRKNNLYFSNINKNSAGTYVCTAENKLGKTTEEFTVTVYPYPKIITKPVNYKFEEGTRARIKCGLPFQTGDQLRWFKNNKFIGITDNTISWSAVSFTDSGTYSCRVSGLRSSHSSHKHVTVGSRPQFYKSKINTNIYYIDGLTVSLDCRASGFPKPNVTWFHNGKELGKRSMAYTLTMERKDIGTYRCVVKNEFSSVTRHFNIINKDI